MQGNVNKAVPPSEEAITSGCKLSTIHPKKRSLQWYVNDGKENKERKKKQSKESTKESDKKDPRWKTCGNRPENTFSSTQQGNQQLDSSKEEKKVHTKQIFEKSGK